MGGPPFITKKMRKIDPLIFCTVRGYEVNLQEMREIRVISHPTRATRLKLVATLAIVFFHLTMAATPVDSLSILLNALNANKDLKDTRLASNDLNAIATIYLDLQQAQLGIKYIERSIDLQRKSKHHDLLASSLATAAQLYLMNNEPDKATSAIDESISIDQRNNDTANTALHQTIKASILERQSEHQEALTLLSLARPVLEQGGNAHSLAMCYNQLGLVLDQLGKRDEAVVYYKKALQQSIKCNWARGERDAERGLWETLRDEKPAIAMLHLERCMTLTDSLCHQISSTSMRAVGASSQQMGITQPSIVSSPLIRWGGLLLLLLLIATLLGLFYVWRKSKAALKMQRQTQSLRDHFFTNITNELQTPLTVIMSAGQQLVDTQKASTEANRHIGEMIVNQGNNMLELVNQLLDIEKVKANIEQPELKHGDIVMFVRMLVDNFTDKAHEHMLSIEFFSPMTSTVVVFAPDYLRKIVHILVDNAIEYTPRNGQIKVALEMVEDNRFRLTVADTGKGIPIEEQQRVFEPFSQQENGDRGVRTVLELSLVNQLVKTINGTIDIHSEIEKGTTITITFPVQKGDSKIVEALTYRPQFNEMLMIKPGENRQKPLVFIVENNEDVAFFIASHLHDNYNLRMAHDGREAFRNAQDMVPDLIITNIVMPVMGGKELTKNLRANPTLNHIPIIAMTSNTSEQERLSCIEAGADAVLVKPFNSSELKLLAHHFITQRNTLRERFINESNVDQSDRTMEQMSKDDKEFMHKLVEVIQAQMSKDDIDMEHIAAALSLSRKQLRTRVMALTGLNPVAYVLQVRLNYARRMIASEGTSLTAIASKCGFQNLSHFSKSFKQQFGVSPMQFRKSSGNYGQAER